MLVKSKFEIFQDSLKACKVAFYYSLLFSFISNLMMLAVPIYSLQVLDRVISSNSIDTLIMLTLVVVIALTALSLIQWVRSSLLIRLGDWLDRKLAPLFFEHGIFLSNLKRQINNSQNLQDLSTIKSFLTGAGINAILDAPWASIFIIVLFFIHPSIGLLSIIGGVILLTIAIINEIKTKKLLNESGEYSFQSSHYADSAARNAEAIEAMGMLSNIVKIWHDISDKALSLQSKASSRSSVFSSITRFFRLLIQISVTGVGAYYVIHGQMTVGAMIAAGILVGRSLAPYENAIASWKSFVAARKSLSRLNETLENTSYRTDTIELPEPKGFINVENVFFVPYGSQKPTLRAINFSLLPGDILAVIGPSASGKSTLAKLLMGIWKAQSGNLRLDNADIYSWSRENFGKYVGYLPQDVELFAGTVKANIARMDLNAKDEDIIQAAKDAQVHDLILRLPNGYETQIGVSGVSLSAGQRQRIALARAFYGNPKFMVLDEPNANLDFGGEMALKRALSIAKQKQITTIIISHRPAILNNVDKILALNNGVVTDFDQRDKVLQSLNDQKNKKLKAVAA